MREFHIIFFVWFFAVLTILFLMIRVNRLEDHVEQMSRKSGELQKSVEALDESTRRLEDSVCGLRERTQEKPAPKKSQPENTGGLPTHQGGA